MEATCDVWVKIYDALMDNGIHVKLAKNIFGLILQDVELEKTTWDKAAKKAVGKVVKGIFKNHFRTKM